MALRHYGGGPRAWEELKSVGDFYHLRRCRRIHHRRAVGSRSSQGLPQCLLLIAAGRSRRAAAKPIISVASTMDLTDASICTATTSPCKIMRTTRGRCAHRRFAPHVSSTETRHLGRLCVFINMNPDCVAFGGISKAYSRIILDPFELEKQLRYRWYLTLTLPANWKVALEAFMEGVPRRGHAPAAAAGAGG